MTKANDLFENWGFRQIDRFEYKVEAIGEVEIRTVRRHQVYMEIGKNHSREKITDDTKVYLFLPAPPLRDGVCFKELTVGEMKKMNKKDFKRWLSRETKRFLDGLEKQGLQQFGAGGL